MSGRSGHALRSRRWAVLMATVIALAATAASTPATDPELAPVATDFQYGKYAEVLRQVQSRLDRGGLSEGQLAELHKFAGLAAFNLSQPAEAQRHLAAFLRIDPDAALDPFVFPPPAIAFFDKLRAGMAAELDAIRQERRLEAERKRRAEEDREQLRREAEEQRRKIEELSRKVTVRTVEKRSFLLNFVPFGAGQFQENRTSLGILLASAEGALAATSIIAYLADASLMHCVFYPLDNRLGAVSTVSVRSCGILPADAPTSTLWRDVKVGSGAAFYALYAYGVVDAVYHHEDQVTSQRVIDQSGPMPAFPEEESGALQLRNRRPPPLVTARVSVIPLPGGIAATLHLDF